MTRLPIKEPAVDLQRHGALGGRRDESLEGWTQLTEEEEANDIVESKDDESLFVFSVSELILWLVDTCQTSADGDFDVLRDRQRKDTST